MDSMIDSIIKNGKTIEGSLVNVYINQGKILDVTDSSVETKSSADRILDLKGEHYISAGWIDDHVHCYEKMDLYYDVPDRIGVEQGVTTIIDAGSTGAENIVDFSEGVKKAKTNVFALLNISKTGIIAQNELENLEHIDQTSIEETINQLPDFIVGLKARMSKSVVGENDVLPLKRIKTLRQLHPDLPLMVHIGSAPPKLENILNWMRSGDILTHCFNGKENGIINQKTGKVREEAWDAYQRGVVFDIGHGTDSFNFETAKRAYSEGMLSETISTDIYHRNRDNGPVFDLATTMEKMRFIGYEWKDIIRQVTSSPAESFRLKKKGRLQKGMDADITIFTIEDKNKKLIDSNGNTYTAKEQIVPKAVINGGEFYAI